MIQKDMSPYLGVEKTYSIGWSSESIDYPQGRDGFTIISKLEHFINHTKPNILDLYACPFCRLKKKDPSDIYKISTVKLYCIPYENGEYFIINEVLLHMIAAHNYQPPQEFIRVVEKFDVPEKWDNRSIFEKLVIQGARKRADTIMKRVITEVMWLSGKFLSFIGLPPGKMR